MNPLEKKENNVKYELTTTASVEKSKTFILSHYNMSASEQKIILLALSQLKANIEAGTPDPLEFLLPMPMIKKYLNIKSNAIYAGIKDIAAKLTSHKIEMEDTAMGRFEFLVPIPYCKYENGILHIRFDKEMKKELIDAADNFMSKYMIANFQHLKSSYSIRVYEILKMYLMDKTIPVKENGYKEVSFDLEEFKLLVGSNVKRSIDNTKQPIGDNIEIITKYTQYSDFKKHVLNVALKEVNESTDISFKYMEQKDVRKVEKLTFWIKDKLGNDERIKEKLESTSNSMQDLFELIDIVSSFLPDLKINEINKLITAANYNVEQIRMAKVLLDKKGCSDNEYENILELLESSAKIPSFKEIAKLELEK